MVDKTKFYYVPWHIPGECSESVFIQGPFSYADAIKRAQAIRNEDQGHASVISVQRTMEPLVEALLSSLQYLEESNGDDKAKRLAQQVRKALVNAGVLLRS